MLTTGWNALALMRFGGFHGGGRGGFGLLIGLAAIGAAIWTASRSQRSERAKS